jgi:hypothetical protein|tara:strand:- start:186 stop:461 length:276 start_codon:yes stop_codon:yes gene_type:complete
MSQTSLEVEPPFTETKTFIELEQESWDKRHSQSEQVHKVYQRMDLLEKQFSFLQKENLKLKEELFLQSNGLLPENAVACDPFDDEECEACQ